ncbi:MAG: ABC transporter ATP-binding protein [Gemmatales bacterium]
MSQRSAFKRARQYLWYRPIAPTLSFILAPFSGFFLVIMLGLVGLLVDLAVTRGVVTNPQAVQRWVEQNGNSPVVQAAAKMAHGPQGVGILSLAIRTQSTFLGELFNQLAESFPDLRNNYVYLLTLIAGILIAAVLFSLISFLQKRTAAAAAIDAITRLRRSVHTHAYRLGSLTMRQVSKGPIIGSTMRALDTLQEGLYAWFIRTVHEPCNLLWLLGFLVLVDSVQGIPWTSLVLLAAAGLYWLIGSWITAAARKAERRDTLRAAEGQTLLMESLGLHRLVKIYGMEQYSKNRLERLLHRQGNAIQSRWYWQFLSRHGRWTLIAILGPLLALALVGNILDHDLRFIPVVVILITIACLYLVLQRWQTAWHQVRKAGPAAQGLFQLLDHETDVKQVVGAEFLPPLAHKLDLINVTVLSPGTEEVLLDGFSLNIASGEHVALVGDERARLIVAYLLPRLIDPDQGEVRVDDKPLPWVTLESVRHQVGVVLQDDLVFNDTVAGNIGCGNEAFSLPRIIEAAKAAHAHNFIMKLPAGYETVIGELGESLSVSQRFRIALARAILRDPTIMVIEEPDEGLSEDDKAWFDDTLTRFLQGRTTILLPQRLSTMRKADRVVMLHQGTLIDQGTDADLIRRCPRYKHWQYMKFHHFHNEGE